MSITVIELTSSFMKKNKMKNISDNKKHQILDEIIFSENNQNNEIDENIINETENEIIE